jgi:putative methionine-R-sulfoxide reductase with GAF domain
MNELLKIQLESIVAGEQDTIANLANASAVLMEGLEHVNGVGF